MHNSFLHVRNVVGASAAATLVMLASGAASAQSAEVQAIALFNGANGSAPLAGLIKTSDGHLVGTTMEGGRYDNCTSGCGSVYKLEPGGKIGVVFKFLGAGRMPGYHASGELMESSDGWLYGTTSWGGVMDGCESEGCGTIFRTSIDGVRTTMARMTRATGIHPSAALVQHANGDLYGTAARGGSFTSCLGGEFGCGTVFRLGSDKKVAAVVNFDGSNGSMPTSNLVVGSDGQLYGTTLYGGQFDAGTVFRVNGKGQLTTLMSFDGAAQGNGPYGGVTLGPDGHFYGVTVLGGAHNHGTVFRLTRHGGFRTLHSFDGLTNGSRPYAALTVGRDGKLFGTTHEGGPSDRGTAFSITTSGVFALLATFDAFGDVNFPMGRLLETEDGVFLGSSNGGVWGSVYQLTTAR
jgi:uncharacterized repeat protein (TIGR03803 family)